MMGSEMVYSGRLGAHCDGIRWDDVTEQHMAALCGSRTVDEGDECTVQHDPFFSPTEGLCVFDIRWHKFSELHVRRDMPNLKL